MKFTSEEHFEIWSDLFRQSSQYQKMLFDNFRRSLKHFSSEMGRHNNLTHTLIVLHLKHSKSFFYTLSSIIDCRYNMAVHVKQSPVCHSILSFSFSAVFTRVLYPMAVSFATGYFFTPDILST